MFNHITHQLDKLITTVTDIENLLQTENVAINALIDAGKAKDATIAQLNAEIITLQQGQNQALDPLAAEITNTTNGINAALTPQ